MTATPRVSSMCDFISVSKAKVEKLKSREKSIKLGAYNIPQKRLGEPDRVSQEAKVKEQTANHTAAAGRQRHQPIPTEGKHAFKNNTVQGWREMTQ